MRSLMLSVFILLPTVSLAQPLAPGDVVGLATFKDIRYLPRTVQELGDHKAYLLAFTALKDEASENVHETLKALAGNEAYHDVEVAAINVAPMESISDIATDALKRDARYTVLEDWNGTFAASVGVASYPAAVVLDEDRKLVYRGSVDEAVGVVDALRDGQAVTPRENAIEGTPIRKWEVPEASTTVTFAKDIAPIIDKHCLECHRPGEAAPFTLRSYKQVSARADMIEEVVLEERMPPWYASRAHGDFINNRRLSLEEKHTISQWIAAGKPEGDPADRPEPPAFPESEWHIGEPDLIVEAAEEHELPATGYIPYKYTTFEYVFPEETWIQGIEIMPSNPQTVHHANLAYTAVSGPEKGNFNFLTGRVPGGSPVDIQDPVAMRIPAGSAMMLQIHYVTTGKPEKNLMRVGIRYAEGPVIKRVRHTRIRPETITIPPGDPFHQLTASWTLDTNATIIGLFSHMHLRGRDMTFFAEYPDGKEETLLTIPNYSFDWQLAYLYSPGMKQLPEGTRIRTVSHYDNSAFNPYNPDPTETVHYGDQTYHEMNDAYMFYLDNSEFLRMVIDGDTGRPVDPAE